MKPLVLIVEDEEDMLLGLQHNLEFEGYRTLTAKSGRAGLEKALTGTADLILLDVMLPGLSGFDVLKQLREAGSKTPVLMLTARGDDVDRIVGLDLGADDYLPKPFNPRELLARVKAILRRTTEPESDEPAELTVGALRVNLRRREAWLGAESGSQRILDAMRKGTRVPEISAARTTLGAEGIRVGFFLQLGYLGEHRVCGRPHSGRLHEQLHGGHGVSG